MPALFIPGWGAHPSLYREALPSGWEVLAPPSFRASSGSFAAYPAWLRSELESRTGPFVLGGHSFGAALAVLAASGGAFPIERLVLVDPAGLPLSKPNRACLADFASQLRSGIYPLGPAARSIGSDSRRSACGASPRRLCPLARPEPGARRATPPRRPVHGGHCRHRHADAAGALPGGRPSCRRRVPRAAPSRAATSGSSRQSGLFRHQLALG